VALLAPLLFLLPDAAAAQARYLRQWEARPALWVVGDSDTIIYLFGTFHAHDGRARWFDRAVKTAFDGSDELILETLIPEDPQALAEALARYRASRGGSAIPPSPGLAGAKTAMSAARSAGLSVDLGADAVLRRAASASGKHVDGLESFEFQLRMYDQLPARSPIAASQPHAAAPNPAVAEFLRQMQAAWNRGDPTTFEAVVGAVHAQSPIAYRLLFEQRNAEWAGWIVDRLNQPGTVFVAVGTGHLVGRDSVQAKLAARGIRSARIS
jgi:uncharacterized protein YbaP (TraB family)